MDHRTLQAMTGHIVLFRLEAGWWGAGWMQDKLGHSPILGLPSFPSPLPRPETPSRDVPRYAR